MTFTYLLTTPVGLVRLELGDTTEPALFTDEEIGVKLDGQGGRVLLAAADLADILAVRYSQGFNFETDGQKFNLGDRARNFQALAKQLRERAEKAGGISVATTTRVDGYSDNLSTRDGARHAPRCDDFDTAPDVC